MPGGRHNGDRKPRAQFGTKKPSLGYYLVFTDTEDTENEYFKGLKASLPNEIRNELVIKVIRQIKTSELIRTCLEIRNRHPQYSISWLVFDRDRVTDFDKIISEAEDNDIKVGWSNPCFEVWLHAYFQNPPYAQDSVQCCGNFGTEFKSKTNQEYQKSDPALYQKLVRFGDEELAISRSKTLCNSKEKLYSNPSEMVPCTKVFLLVEEIRGKCD